MIPVMRVFLASLTLFFAGCAHAQPEVPASHALFEPWLGEWESADGEMQLDVRLNGEGVILARSRADGGGWSPVAPTTYYVPDRGLTADGALEGRRDGLSTREAISVRARGQGLAFEEEMSALGIVDLADWTRPEGGLFVESGASVRRNGTIPVPIIVWTRIGAPRPLHPDLAPFRPYLGKWVGEGTPAEMSLHAAPDGQSVVLVRKVEIGGHWREEISLIFRPDPYGGYPSGYPPGLEGIDEPVDMHDDSDPGIELHQLVQTPNLGDTVGIDVWDAPRDGRFEEDRLLSRRNGTDHVGHGVWVRVAQ